MAGETQAERRIDAVLFDLDGVLVDTARVHAKAWKATFDGYLAGKGRSDRFELPDDYRTYVDGKPRYDGVRDFLESRGIHLPEGDPSDPPDRETICGVGNKKNEHFHELLADGVDVLPGAFQVLDELRSRHVAIGLVTSSKNADAVLKVVGMEGRFDAQVDGNVLADEHLAGKPDPAAFLEGARRLGVPPARAVVVEDAESGVEAGRRGHFGCVVGIAGTNPEAVSQLEQFGADVVVSDVGKLDPDPDRWARPG